MRGRWMWVACLLAAATAGAQPNPVTNGGFEEIGAQGFPAGWEPVGATVTVSDGAHTGRGALRLEMPAGKGAPPEVGLNRAWRPDSGEQGAMLGERKGGLVFWYKLVSAAPTAQVSVVVIPMNGRPYEEVGATRAMASLPHQFAGDGQWHEGRLAYDYSSAPAVKWVHVGARITSGPAVLLLDDVAWVERVGPVLQIERARVYPDARRPDAEALLTAALSNAGDARAEGLQVGIEAPSGIQARLLTPAEPLAPGDAQVLRWNLTGPMEAGRVAVTATGRGAAASARADLVPQVEVESLLAAPGIAPPGGLVVVTATLRNRGTAIARPAATLVLLGGRLFSPARQTTAVAPGGRAVVRWRVRMPVAPGQVTAACKANGAASGARSVIVVTDAVERPAERLAGALWIRRGRDRTIGELRMPGGGTPVARLPHIGNVLVRLPAGGTEALLPRYGTARRAGGEARLVGTARDHAGGVWRFTVAARPASPTTTRLTIAAQCDRPRTVLLLEGPMLLVGDGTTREAKTDAVFPGLEWLAGSEVSSSDLDILAEHADRQRFVPHPNKVTVPAMGVHTTRGTVGLLWSMRERWDGQHDRPQPVFAAPDRLAGTASCRMGLVAPNVLNGLPENALRAAPGYELPAGRSMTIAATLYADPAGRDSLAAMDAWFRSYRPSPVLPAPQGSDVRQVAWSMQAYTRTLWLSPEAGWMPFQGGPAIWRNAVFDPAFAYDIEQALRIAPQSSDAPAWRRRLQEAREHVPAPQGDDYGFDSGAALARVGDLGAAVSQLVASQGADGAWRFDANRRDTGVFKGLDYHELGADGAVELGTCAQSAYQVLLYARVTGDAGAYRAGVKALEAMGRFTIPRAAQVWEVPVHSPDILAAADAVDAYLEAYRYTQGTSGHGDARWLREARKWARAGLPFVYVWNAPGKPWMRYGSIPVFGASWNQWSWFGNIVQWNGLRYAYALLKLHAYDPAARWGGMSWRDLALGITRSAMYQQSTDERNLALWPDSYHTITDLRSGWDFPPRIPLKNMYALLGRDVEPRTVDVAVPGGRVRVSSTAQTLRASWHGGRLVARVVHAQRQGGSVLVASVSRPSSVRLDGKAIGVAPQPAGSSAAGWQYDEARHLLLVRVPHDGPATVAIGGGRPIAGGMLVRMATSPDFDFRRGLDGWIAARDVTDLSATTGVLTLRTTGGDPYIVRPACRFADARVRTLTLRIRGSGDGSGQLFWTTAASPAYDEAKSVRFTFPPDGQWHEVTIPVTGHPLWRGQIVTGLRIDPGNVPGADIAIAWMRGG